MIFLTAVGVGFLHTLVGPDHYLPFIVIGRARRWGLAMTSLLTFVCGLGHILSSVVIGLIGIAAGTALQNVQGWESSRGEWAGWALLLLGGGYMLWGFGRALRGRRHGHHHLHDDGTLHRHDHHHHDEDGHPSVHGHAHDDHPPDAAPASWRSLTPWLLFLVFVLGPCEPLIPLFFASALVGAWDQVALVVLGYGVATLFAMHVLVTLFWLGLRKVNLGPLERWSHALAGAVILLAGVSMVFLGL